MAQFNTGNNAFQAQAKTIFEVNQIATIDGQPVTANNRFPVDIGNTSISISGNVNITTDSNTNIHHSNSTPITPAAPLPVTGNVVVSSGNVAISGPVSVTQNTTPWIISGSITNIFDPGTVDSFGRQRVSEPYTLADYSHVYGEEAELLTATSNAAIANTTPVPSEASILLSVGAANNAYVIHQSRMFHHYMPGKSQLGYSSFAFGAARANTYKRNGFFGHRNGIFFQQKGDGTYQIVFRSDVTGSIVDTEVQQAEWNQDTLSTSIAGTATMRDGSNAPNFGVVGSVNLDFTKSQLFYIDYQWLGVGRLRVGFVHDGNIIIAHEFHHSNYDSTVYWSNPNLPMRCEVRNYGTAVGVTAMSQMCATVMSEGGYKESGVDYSADSGKVELTKGNPGAYKVCMALRLKNTYRGQLNRSIVRLNAFDMFSDSASCQWELWRLPNNAAVTGGSWVDAGTDSVVEYNVTATSYSTTGGERMDSGWIAANNPSGKQASGQSGSTDPTSAKRGYISQNIDSDDSNIFALIVRDLSTTSDTNVYAAIQWRETR